MTDLNRPPDADEVSLATGRRPGIEAEARRRIRRRTIVRVAGSVAVLAVCALVPWAVLDLQSSPPPATRPPPVSPPAAERITLFGDGVDTVHFGQPETTTVARLTSLLGPPPSRRAIDMAGNCTIDSAVQWPTITVYFDRGRFVGYSTLAASGEALPRAAPVPATARGLEVGDTLDSARRIYRDALTTSLAQGGSWFVATAQGTLDGYLTGEPNRPGPAPRIASIEAGSVGCPAASP